MQAISSLLPNRAYEFMILNVDIVGSSKLTANDAPTLVQKTKSNLFDHFRSMASRFMNIHHVSGDGFFFLFPIDDPQLDFDFCAQLAIDLYETLRLFNENRISGNLLTPDISVRMTGHIGNLHFHTDPGQISGGDLDILLKNERQIGRPNHLTITHALYSRVVAQQLRRRFQKRDGQLDASILQLTSLYDYPQTDANPLANVTTDMNAELQKLKGVVSATLKAFATWDAKMREQEGRNYQQPQDLPRISDELKKIEEQFNTDYEDLWISEAKGTIRAELESMEIDFDRKVVYVYEEDGQGFTALKNLSDLKSYLVEKSNQSFYSSVPFDGGEAVWRDDSESWVEDALHDYREKWVELGWDGDL